MNYDEKKYEFTLTTGKIFSAYCGYIGINPEFSLSEGYDGLLDYISFTQQEKIEIADYMINLWNDYKKRTSND
jgi:hypothetical protein